MATTRSFYNKTRRRSRLEAFLDEGSDEPSDSNVQDPYTFTPSPAKRPRERVEAAPRDDPVSSGSGVKQRLTLEHALQEIMDSSSDQDSLLDDSSTTSLDTSDPTFHELELDQDSEDESDSSQFSGPATSTPSTRENSRSASTGIFPINFFQK